ncbi:MAG: phosphate ABC transporter permease PstA [Candidatus Enteromonas sp.]|nr:phosphate ABC transporter permease PstA [Candidatus Enteromonas sp.]
MNKVSRARRGFYEGLRYSTFLALALGIVALLAIIVFVIVKGGNALTFPFIFGEYEDKPTLLPALGGTLIVALIALGIGLPLGIGAAVFLSEYASNDSKFVSVLRVAIETLASIPSIVYGLFGYLIFVVGIEIGGVKLFGWGYSLLGGGLTLAIMVLPLVTKNVEEALREVPSSLREASFALGAGKAHTVRKVVLPSAAPGIITSVILSLGRVLSESAVLLLTVGMVVNITPKSPLDAGTTLALNIYYFASFGYTKEACATSLLLLVLVLVLNLTAYFILYLHSRRTLHGKVSS